MQQTLSKVKNLEKFLQKHGDDAIISGTISWILDYKINKYHGEIKRLDKSLKKFERTYKKESSDFFREFKKGRRGAMMLFSQALPLCGFISRLPMPCMERQEI